MERGGDGERRWRVEEKERFLSTDYTDFTEKRRIKKEKIRKGFCTTS